ncbi:MAG: hypothetical protein HC822_19935 [Oscillochloris sp.]|nr:hypothetical protein [Oscillochloris sp.]
MQVLSLNNQPITLPAGTEFTAVKPDGQEVAFLSTADVVVPPSTISDQGAQIITSRGVANVPVAARSPGSASNVDANTIRRMTIPGGGSFSVESGALIVRHDPIVGGSEVEALVVKESDVRRALGPALTALDAEGRNRLQAAAANAGLEIEADTITPRRSDLEQLSGFQYDVMPSVGSRLDPGVTQFTLQVSAAYAALATPSGQPLAGPALQNAFAEQLRQAGRLAPGDCRAPAIEDWRWDGSTLFVTGSIGPDPRCGNDLEPAARQQVLAAVQGKSLADARIALEELQAAGLIGGFTLPEVTQFPEREQQIELVVE